MKRRTFMKALSSTVILGATTGFAPKQRKPHFLFGACRGLSQAKLMKEAGFDYIEGGAASVLKPEISDEAFKSEIEKIKALPLPVRSCNGFIPGKFRLTGPNPTHEEALKYAELLCRRADLAGISFIVLGSGGARNAPEGFEIKKAEDQFVQFCQKLGDRIADCKMTVVLEPLRREEANYMRKVSEGADFVDRINRPKIQLLADMYHMRCEGETADSILKGGKRILHCHIAEKEKRMPPGTKGESFKDYFDALKKIGYVGGVSCEGAWPRKTVRPIEEAYALAVQVMRDQSGQN